MNLACGYQQIEKYSKAQKWFRHAIMVKNDWSDAYFGLAICQQKLNQF